MNTGNPNRLAKKLFVFVISTAIVAGCASKVFPDPETQPPPSQGDTRTGQGSQVEEIVVTASRVAKRSQADRRILARRPRLSMNDAGSFAPGPGQSRVSAGPMAPGEELWIIAVPSGEVAQLTADDLSPGSGAMLARFPEDIDTETDSPREIPLPLKHTAVDAVINGYISTVNVTQQFENPFSEKIEAVYMFPLPEKAAISEFVMVIGERRIRGILREKEEAEDIYREARAQGYQASLLVQHRPNIFEQKVANIEPGKAIDVNITYFHTLAYNDGWYSFVFPTVVGPRYNPPQSVDPIVPVPRGSLSPGADNTKVEYLPPNERSAHDLNISVQINAGVTIEELESTHEIIASRDSADSATVTLANLATIPNRDFILNFKVAGDRIKSNLLTYLDPLSNQGYFTLMMYPPSDLKTLQRQPMEMVFVLDCSGSMSGAPLDQAKNAVNAALDHLQEGDTFQIIRFSDNASHFGATPLPATARNIQRARTYLRNLHSMGGTQMIEGIKAALDFPHNPSRLRFVSFMTDGYIGNETDIIRAVHERIGNARIFSFGVGSSVNRYLMERMAKEGRGAVAYLGLNDSAKDIMTRFFDRISHPALTDVDINWGSMAVSDVYPAKLPDMIVGRPVVVTGKFLGTPGGISVSGITGNRNHQFSISAAGTGSANVYLPKIWARLRIADLADRQAWEQDPYSELESAIRNTALKYQLMSDYTSFVAVDSSQQTEGDHGTTVNQALPIPDGVRYETTVNRN
jgi:Ca-activated chloride channel homolog